MKPILIQKGAYSHYGLNDYTDNHRCYHYQCGKEIYYFSIHNMPQKKEGIFVFDTDQKLVVLLHPRGILSFKMSRKEDQWEPDARVAKTISPDILELIRQKLIFKTRIR